MPELAEWQPYAVERLAKLMRGITDDWWLSGGEALDRFVGGPTREHGDVDVSIPTSEFIAVTTDLARRFDVRIASRGRLYPLAEFASVDPAHNIWVREPGDGPWRWQLNLEPCDGTIWTYRRDARVVRARADAIVTFDGVPCTAPAVQLLWKAETPVAKDEHDRAVVVPLLPEAERVWLADAIALAHPASPWR